MIVEETEIESVEDEWIPPKPTSPDGIFYVKLALAWKRKSDEKDKRLRKKEAELETVKTELARVQSDYEMDHQEFISLQGENRQLASEVDGLLRREMNVDERVTAELLSEVAAHHKIDDTISGRKPNILLRVTWEIVAIVSVLVVVWQIGYNPNFRDWVGQYIFAIMIVVAVIAYLAFRVQKGRKK